MLRADTHPPPPPPHTHTPCEQEVSKVGIPIMLYNIPGRCGGGGLTSASIAELYKLPMVSTFFFFFYDDAAAEEASRA